jgi:acyl-CoA dehydrogenase
VRKNIAAVKAVMPKVLHDISERALHLHGSLGLSTEMPFTDWLVNSYHVGLADGPTEVHKITVAREVLKEYEGTTQLFPDYHGLNEMERAHDLYDELLGELDA